ncbi:MAG: helix-turn-helix domain-containing protein [Nitrospirae bacterium]|nr:helix-turn-helix domain-containing protein [Nitrospirota bacterium]
METTRLLKTLGDKIRTVRKAKKISQEKLAELSGLHPTYISDIENGKVNASIYSYYMIANALGTPLSELLTLPSDKIKRKTENEIAEILTLLRGLSRKKQAILLPAIKGLISGLRSAKS